MYAREEKQRGLKKKNSDGKEEEEEEGPRRVRRREEKETRNRGNEKSSWTGYSPRMPSWLLLFLDLRTDAPRMS